MKFDTFKQIYDKLSGANQLRVFHLLQNLEHAKGDTKDKVDYSSGLKIALKEHDMTIDDLVEKLDENPKYQGQQGLRELIASLIIRGSRHSSCFEDVLEILEIDETYLINNSEYFQKKTRSIEWCFTHLSSQNQEAVYLLTVSLLSDDFTLDSLFAECDNIGISTDDD